MTQVFRKLLDVWRAVVDGLHGGYLSRLDRRTRRLEEAAEELLAMAHSDHDTRQTEILHDFLRDLEK